MSICSSSLRVHSCTFSSPVQPLMGICRWLNLVQDTCATCLLTRQALKGWPRRLLVHMAAGLCWWGIHSSCQPQCCPRERSCLSAPCLKGSLPALQHCGAPDWCQHSDCLRWRNALKLSLPSCIQQHRKRTSQSMSACVATLHTLVGCKARCSPSGMDGLQAAEGRVPCEQAVYPVPHAPLHPPVPIALLLQQRAPGWVSHQ